MNKLKQHIQEIGERFSEYSKVTGLGLRCDECDCKYLGNPQITQLCVRCNLAQTLNTTLDILIEWHKGEMEKGAEDSCCYDSSCCVEVGYQEAHQQAIDYLEASKTNHD